MLLDALHVNPRASFEQLGAALGVSAVTAGRRWRRLAEAGQAWVSSAPGPRMPLVGALFEAECAPGRVAGAAAALAALPQVFSVHLVSGTRDLYALVAAGDSRTLSGLVLDRMPAVPGLIRVRTSVTTEVFSGRHWRLGAISAAQAGAVRAQEPEDQEQAPDRVPDRFDRELFLALQDDGRAAYRTLAERLGKSEQAVKRRMSALLRSGQLTFRTDFVRPQGGWPVQVALWLQVPDEQLELVGRQLGEWPQTRVCLAVVGKANLFVTLQLHGLHALDGVLRRMRGSWPQVRIAEREVVLRSVKSWGRMLDEDGYATSVIPVDIWAPV